MSWAPGLGQPLEEEATSQVEAEPKSHEGQQSLGLGTSQREAVSREPAGGAQGRAGPPE